MSKLLLNDIEISQLRSEEIAVLSACFKTPWSSREVIQEKFTRYYQEQQAGKRVTLIAKKNNRAIGYGTLVFISHYAYFKRHNIPEIKDLWVCKNYRKQGIASLLIAQLEKLASARGFNTMGIGVGLYADYGAAQRLYVKLGYIPDGNGITHKELPVIPGDEYPIDDDLILWLIKKIN